MTHDATRWLIVGHFRGPNLGDEAMLLALLQMLGEQHEEAVVSTKDGRLGPEHTGAGRSSFQRGFLREVVELRRCHGLILGGGSHFHDGYRSRRMSAYHFASMSRYVLLILFARALGARVLMLGVGFGPFRRPTTRFLCRAALKLSHEVVVRDEASRACALDLAPRRAIHLGFDLAAALPPCRPPRRDRISSGHRVVGIAPAQSPREADALDTWSRALSGVLAMPEAELWEFRLYVFNQGHTPDEPLVEALDRVVSARGHRSMVIRLADRPRKALESLSECDAMLSGRYHAAVLTYLLDVPQVILPYHRKLFDFAAEVQLPDEAVVDRGSAVVAVPNALRHVMSEGPRMYGMPRSVAEQRAQESAHAIRRQASVGN